MIVLAESNLVLELVFHQEQSSEVESLVSLAETQQMELVIREREDGEELFVNKNSRDFGTTAIEDHLDRYGCKLITNFREARRIVEQAIQAARTRIAAGVVVP